ncbi:Hypothetical_protein [Hexamita inflata]|uniref:Hypothetical_protein n=1 Tax=Hexamita inflata TaxID=28002 RepID=A0AA86QRU2_9EUKA|nr:Hypothetical protein HINF_LOCUS49557 [Hexamita inflata]
MLGCKFLLAEPPPFILFLALCRVSNIPPGNLSWLPCQILGVLSGRGAWLCAAWGAVRGLLAGLWVLAGVCGPGVFCVGCLVVFSAQVIFCFSLFTFHCFSYRESQLILVSGVPGLVSGREVGVLALGKQVLRDFVKKQGKSGFRLDLA